MPRVPRWLRRGRTGAGAWADQRRAGRPGIVYPGDPGQDQCQPCQGDGRAAGGSGPGSGRGWCRLDRGPGPSGRIAPRRSAGNHDVRLLFAGATAAIDAIVARRRQIDAEASAQGATAALIAVRDQLGEMSEFAGLRGSVNGLISRGGHASGPEAQAMGVLVGRIDGAWSAIAARIDSFPDAVRHSIETAGGPGATISGRCDGRDEAAARGGLAGLGRRWFSQASTAIDALLVAQARSGAAIDQAWRRKGRAPGTA